MEPQRKAMRQVRTADLLVLRIGAPADCLPARKTPVAVVQGFTSMREGANRQHLGEALYSHSAALQSETRRSLLPSIPP